MSVSDSRLDAPPPKNPAPPIHSKSPQSAQLSIALSPTGSVGPQLGQDFESEFSTLLLLKIKRSEMSVLVK
eukprot:4316468-Amphidinium_carterae.1